MIEKIFIISFIVHAIWFTLQEGEIFGKLGNILSWYLPEKLHKPVFDCSICMAGIHGCYLYWIIYHNSIKEWIIVNIAIIGLNVVLNKLFPPHKIEIKPEDDGTHENISAN